MPRSRALVVLLAILAAAAFAMPAGASEKTDKIKHLVMIMHVVDQVARLGDLIAHSTIENLRKENPSVTQEAVDDLEAAIKDEMKQSLPELIDLLVPIWDKNYSDEDVTALLQFYDSPAGQSVIAKQAKVLEDSGAVYKAWAPQFGQRIIQRVEETAKQKGLKL
jgi:uncharacterized protein